MIYISQGHEKGIGLEVFFKSLLSLPQSVLKLFCLVANPESCHETLKSLGVHYTIKHNNIELFSKKVSLIPIKADKLGTESSSSLLHILSIIKSDDILVTLPTSKDQLVLNHTNCAGYTEFFRKYFNRDNIAMIFKSYDLKILLLTDHIALNKVSITLNKLDIELKVRETLEGLEQFFGQIPQDIFFSGINPHAGEGGILGREDLVITQVISALAPEYSQISFKGPLPGDTLHFHHNLNRDQLFVYSFHDQGLPFFKDKYGLFGINISMGLDFLRMSVDHGTAFSLFGKNQASSSGCLYVLNEAYKVHASKHHQG